MSTSVGTPYAIGCGHVACVPVPSFEILRAPAVRASPELQFM
jgi:hypothetical protein